MLKIVKLNRVLILFLLIFLLSNLSFSTAYAEACTVTSSVVGSNSSIVSPDTSLGITVNVKYNGNCPTNLWTGLYHLTPGGVDGDRFYQKNIQIISPGGQSFKTNFIPSSAGYKQGDKFGIYVSVQDEKAKTVLDNSETAWFNIGSGNNTNQNTNSPPDPNAGKLLCKDPADANKQVPCPPVNLGVYDTPLDCNGQPCMLYNALHYNNIPELLLTLTNIFLIFLAVFSVAMVIYGAFRMVTSGGSESALKAGKTAVIWAVAAMALALLAFSIVSIIQRLLGAA